MKEVLQTIIENLVDDKASISINEIEGEKSVVFEVKVAEADMGKIIGKQGKRTGTHPHSTTGKQPLGLYSHARTIK